MGQKWYRKNVVKSIWILAEHVFLLVMAASFLWLMSYPVLRSEIFNGTHADQYEDTKAFADQVLHTGEGISAGIAQKEDFETDGYYDPDKIIDAAKYVGSDVAGGESESLSYRLEDMVAWGEALNQDTGEAAGDEGNIIVCRRSDGTYHYYEYSEFQDLIQNGELSFVMASEEGGMTQEEILLSLRDRTFSEGMSDLFKGVQDQEGRILYVDCWNYDGYWYKEECKTAEGKSILDVANEDPAWNGHLSEAFDIVETAVQSVYWNMDHYQRLLESYQEGDTNLTYLYVDQTAKEIVSNREEYREGQDLEATLDKIRESGKYAIIYPRLADFETNMKNVDAAEWRNALQVNGKEDAYIFALSVDTTYPVQDSFYTESQTYAQYGGTAVWVFAAGVAAAILFALGLIWLTLAAGRRPEDEALHLNSFDHWKTEIAALLVFVLWLVPVLLLGSTVPCKCISKQRVFFYRKYRGDDRDDSVQLRDVSGRLSEPGTKDQGRDTLEGQPASQHCEVHREDFPKSVDPLADRPDLRSRHIVPLDCIFQLRQLLFLRADGTFRSPDICIHDQRRTRKAADQKRN